MAPVIVPFGEFGQPIRRSPGRTLSDATIDRAELLADLVEIQSEWPFSATVPGRIEPEYTVTFSTADLWRCQCMSYLCRFDCAHVQAVQCHLRNNRQHDDEVRAA